MCVLVFVVTRKNSHDISQLSTSIPLIVRMQDVVYLSWLHTTRQHKLKPGYTHEHVLRHSPIMAPPPPSVRHGPRRGGATHQEDMIVKSV